MKTEFIFERSTFAASHSSTIVETSDGLLAAWFAGPQARHPEVSLWSARYDGKTWSAPTEVINGIQDDGRRYQCWNPVLFQPSKGPLLLFYKVGPSPETWWGMSMTSTNQGQTWSKPVRLPQGFIGPVRNKPVELAEGSLFCGASTEDDGWRIHMERTADRGATWERTKPLNDRKESSLIQPTILRWPSGRTQILCRSKQGKVFESWMGDDWKRWEPIKPTLLPNPNSAIDSVLLNDGRALLVYNHTPDGRSPLNVAISRGGRQWNAATVLENESVEATRDTVCARDDTPRIDTLCARGQRTRHIDRREGEARLPARGIGQQRKLRFPGQGFPAGPRGDRTGLARRWKVTSEPYQRDDDRNCEALP